MQKKIETKTPESTPFHQACAEGDLQKCQELFADNLLSGDKIYPEYLSTGLNFAVQNNHAEVVSWLFENNASIYDKNPNTKNAGGQFVDMPFDENNKSCQTAFSFCSKTEIHSLLIQRQEYFTQPQYIVIQCESIICQLKQALINIKLIPPIIDTIQSLVTKTVTYTDSSIVALNALAKAFFDLECYTQARFCYESVKHLLNTKKYQSETQVRTAFNLDTAKKFLEYNLSVVQLKINANSGEHTNNFEKIGDGFVTSKNHMEAEQCYKKAIFHWEDSNKTLQITLYLKLIKTCTDRINSSLNKKQCQLYINTIKDNLNSLLKGMKEITSLDKTVASALQNIINKLYMYNERIFIGEFCEKFIALNIERTHTSWVSIELYYLITSQVDIDMVEDLFKNMLDNSPKFAAAISDAKDYWYFLNLLYTLGQKFTKNNNHIHADQCYKAVFGMSDGKRVKSGGDYKTTFKDSGLTLIKTRIERKVEITPDIVDKFLAIEPVEDSSIWSLGAITALWKEVADLLFTNECYAEAEQFYNKIFNLMSSTDWQSIIANPNEDNDVKELVLPIQAGFNLATLQIRRGITIQDVLNVYLRKINRVIQFIEAIDEDTLDEELITGLMNNMCLLFNKLGETISGEKDNQTFHLATQCFLTAYEIALKNSLNQYSDAKPTMEKLLGHYKSMDKKFKFASSLLMVFSPTLSPVNIKASFHSIYTSCIKAIDKSNKIEIQFFTATFNSMEPFVTKSGIKSKDNCSRLWIDFFEIGNNKKRFLELQDRLRAHAQGEIKRQSPEELDGPIRKKVKIDNVVVESESILIEEPAQNQQSMSLVVPEKQQQKPYCYSQSANGFNHFFSIQQNNKQRKAYKSAHHFDWDQTLTKQHVHDWKDAPSADTCKAFLRAQTINTLRFILQSGNYVSIITNGTAYRISWVLLQAGLTQQEIDKISIKAAESPLTIVPNFKPGAIRKLAEEWVDAKHHYFYDDRDNFCTEVWQMNEEFKNKGKNLHVMLVSREPGDCSHLGYAWQKAAESAEEIASIDNTQFSLK